MAGWTTHIIRLTPSSSSSPNQSNTQPQPTCASTAVTRNCLHFKLGTSHQTVRHHSYVIHSNRRPQFSPSVETPTPTEWLLHFSNAHVKIPHRAFLWFSTRSLRLRPVSTSKSKKKGLSPPLPGRRESLSAETDIRQSLIHRQPEPGEPLNCGHTHKLHVPQKPHGDVPSIEKQI